jgi:hypothetical protein
VKALLHEAILDRARCGVTNEPTPFEVHESGRLLHGTKADLKVGDLLVPGRPSDWVGHSPEQLKARRKHLDELKRTGAGDLIDD